MDDRDLIMRESHPLHALIMEFTEHLIPYLSETHSARQVLALFDDISHNAECDFQKSMSHIFFLLNRHASVASAPPAMQRPAASATLWHQFVRVLERCDEYLHDKSWRRALQNDEQRIKASQSSPLTQLRQPLSKAATNKKGKKRKSKSRKFF